MKLTYYTYQFRKYLGRNLTRAEAAVIAPLEIMRIRRRQRRLLVIDPPGVDSRSILIQYLRYIRTIHTPNSDILVMAPTRKAATDLAAPLRATNATNTTIHTASGHYPDRIRGLTYNIALLLDIHSYGSYSPARTRNNFHRIATAIYPVIPPTPHSILILHARTPIPHLHRGPTLHTHTDPALAPPDIPTPTPTPATNTPTVTPLTIPPPEPPPGFMHTPPCIHTRQQRQSSPRV